MKNKYAAHAIRKILESLKKIGIDRTLETLTHNEIAELRGLFQAHHAIAAQTPLMATRDPHSLLTQAYLTLANALQRVTGINRFQMMIPTLVGAVPNHHKLTDFILNDDESKIIPIYAYIRDRANQIKTAPLSESELKRITQHSEEATIAWHAIQSKERLMQKGANAWTVFDRLANEISSKENIQDRHAALKDCIEWVNHLDVNERGALMAMTSPHHDETLSGLLERLSLMINSRSDDAAIFTSIIINDIDNLCKHHQTALSNIPHNLLDSPATAILIRQAESNVKCALLNLKKKMAKPTFFMKSHPHHEEALFFARLLQLPNLISVNMRWENHPLLSLAAYHEYDTLFDALLAHPALLVNAKNSEGNTALHTAALKGRINIFKKLLSHPKIEINSRNANGETPLIIATANGESEMVEMLLDHPKISVNDINHHGNTALIIASSHKLIAIAKALLSHKQIDINMRSSDGSTALIFAIANNHREIAEQLMKHPYIDLSAKNDKNKTAMMYAMEHQDKRMIDMLHDHGQRSHLSSHSIFFKTTEENQGNATHAIQKSSSFIHHT